LQPDIFSELNKQVRGANNEVQLTDAISRTIPEIPFHGFRFDGTRYDCGNSLGYIEANLAFALNRSDLKGQVSEIIKKYQ